MKNLNKKIEVIWEDAVIYTIDSIIPQNLPLIKTKGILIKETEKYILLKNTKSTTNTRKEIKHKDTANFYFIPKGMIVKVKKI